MSRKAEGLLAGILREKSMDDKLKYNQIRIMMKRLKLSLEELLVCITSQNLKVLRPTNEGICFQN